MANVKCPTCKRMRPAGVIDSNGKCDWDRAEAVRAAAMKSVPTIAQVESTLLASIDDLRNRKQMQYLTRGTSVALEYTTIQKEYADYNGILPLTLANLGLADKQKRWPTAMTEVSLTGKTLAVVMAGYGTAIAANERANRTLGRIAVDAKARLKAASTIDAKKAVFNGINWNWTAGF